MNKSNTRIVIAKWYWDMKFDLELLPDSVALDLLFAQASAEVERGWIVPKKKIQSQLKILKQAHNKVQVRFDF